MQVTYDGDFTEPVRISPFIEEDFHGAKIYSARYAVLNSSYSKLALDTALAGITPTAYLVEETKPQEMGGGLVEFTRFYAQLPSTWSDYSSIVYEFPGFLFGYSTINNAERPPITKTVSAQVEYSYYITSNPLTIPAVSAQGYWGAGGVGYPVDNKRLGDISTPTKDTYLGWIDSESFIVAEDSKIKRWRGNIWEREVIRIKAE